ncbi:MAG TPA: histidine phosphatase family protein [Gaiellaceae bacterium]|jgi:phosphohistidine phosphatase SixA|nr:histidine phosphatase family protein [Gaiellaceae bacterium]
MRLFLARHAAAAPGHPDELRPLTPEGREQARALADRLAHEAVEVVVVSPLLRARETGAAIARATGAELRVDERLAPGAAVEDLRDAVDGAGDVVAAVGHQPDCSELAAALGAGEVAFAPATVLELELP